MAESHANELRATYSSLAAIVRDRLSRNLRIRRTLPGEGRLRIDRQLPFLCVYRRPPAAPDAGTVELVTTEASYLFGAGEASHAQGLALLVREISAALRAHFGPILILELWADEAPDRNPTRVDRFRPRFHVVTAQEPPLGATIDALAAGLRDVSWQGRQAEVDIEQASSLAPHDLEPLIAARDSEDPFIVGVGVRPIYRSDRDDWIYPAVLRSLRRQVALAIRKAVFTFAQRDDRPVETRAAATHFEAFGPTALVKAARLVDQQLSDVSQSFDFILQTAPINADEAWEEFRLGRYAAAPKFYYRPLPYEPAQLKRLLFDVPIDRIEDATLIHLFAQKQTQLDRQLSALQGIGTRAFYYDSLQLYPPPDASVVELANAIVDHLPDSPPAKSSPEIADAEAIARAARDHIDHYRQRLPSFAARVEIRDDIAASMMVAHDRLLISERAALDVRAVEPLLNHEVGVHLVTYFNGREQPFQQLYTGLAGYEELQEGLAVFAEYLTGGLGPERWRKLACRVLAVASLVQDHSFVETFAMLRERGKLTPRSAFTTAMRVFRGGGLTKDAIYLRGLCDVTTYLQEGRDLAPLFVGKIALEHVPLVQELRRRDIVGAPALLPRFWDEPTAMQRLERCRNSSLLELLEPKL